MDSVKIRMPDGIQYVPGSLAMTSSSGFTLVESDLSILNSPVFVPTSSSLDNGDFVIFTISKSGHCEAIEFTNKGKLAEDTLSVVRDMGMGDTAITSSYNINYASISTNYVSTTARDTVVNDLPSNVCRKIQITNGGTGYLSRVKHRVVVGSDLEDYVIRYQGDTILPVSSNGDTLFYEFDLTQAPFPNTFGDGDTLLENGEFIIIEECFTVNSCDFSHGTVRHQSYWGCSGSICQFGDIINGNVSLQFSQPNLQSSIDFRDNIVCMDGSDRGIIRMKVWNDGAGPAVLNQLSVLANGANTAIDTSNVFITFNNIDIKSYFPVSKPTINAGLSCGTNVTRFDLESSDFLSSFQLAPGDTVYAEMQYVLCCPESCGDYSRSNPSIQLRGSDLCGRNNRSASQNSGTGGSASVADPIISGISVLTNDQVETICVEYPNYNFLSVTPSDSSYVSFIVGLPDGLVFNDSMATVSYAGTSIPIDTAMVTITGDSLIVHVLLTDMPAQANAPLKVCFDVKADCMDGNGMGGQASLTLGQSTSNLCDPLCMIRLNCSNYDLLVFGCGGPGDCTEGRGNIFSYDVQRISFGYEDPEDDRDWTSFVRADSANVNIKRAMVGDTIRHRSKLGFTAGTSTSWDTAVYRETYTAGAEALLCPDTAWIVIRNGGTTYTVGGLTPTSIQNGFEYDLSVSNLSNLSGGTLPSNYEFSGADTMYLNTQYAFCKANAMDWYSVQPGTNSPAKERQDVVFTGSFEATPVGQNTPYGCGSEAYDQMLFLGAALSVDIKQGGFSGDGCDRNFRYLFEIRQNIGGVLSGYTGTYDFFPDEFRPLYIPDSIVIKKQPDITYDTARLVTQQINNASPPAQAQLEKYIPLTYQTDTTLVFKVRDVHDAWGGMMAPFPYEEENADLRYFIEFKRSCASPLAMRTDLAISYTTPLCPGEDFQTVKTNFSTGNNSDLSSIDFTQTPKSKPAYNKSTCFELKARPRGGKLNYTWLEFPVNINVAILSVQENGVDLPQDTDGRYLMGEHAGNDTRTYVICTNLNSCVQSDFQVLFGWDCNGYPNVATYEGTCSYDTLTYTIEMSKSEIQLNLVSQPGKDQMSGNYPDLCAPLLYELEINSANDGSVFDPRMDITLPIGFMVDSIEADYPNLYPTPNNRETLSYSVSNNVLSVNLYEHLMVVHDSLPGTRTDINPANRQILVRLHGHTDCDFRSGSRLYFTLFGDRPCGGPVIGNGRKIASDRLFIQGLLPYEANPKLEVDIANGITCAISTSVDVSFVVGEGDFVGTDSGIIILSPGIDFVPGSIVCTSPNPANCPMVERIEPDPDNPGGTLVYLSYPSMVREGDTMTYTFDIIAQKNSTCGQMVNVTLENYVTVSGLECDGIPCEGALTGITGSASFDLEISHPDLSFNGLTVNRINSTLYVEYSGSLTVSQRELLAGESIYIKVYCADNGMPTGVAVDSVLITGPVAIGTMVPFVGSFLQSQCDLGNGLIVTAEPVNGCLCTEPDFYQEEVGMEERIFDLALKKTFD